MTTSSSDPLETTNSRRLFEEAQAVLPGGVDSPVRAFRAVGGDPLFIRRARGAWVEDADRNRFVDYVLSWGPMILGHAAPPVIKAVRKAAKKGTSFGAPSALETKLARLVQRFVPSMERLRFVNSGTEATMSAIRVARGFTGRPKIVKFEGCYHGHVDSLLVKAGSGVATLGLPDSPGVTQGTVQDTIVLPFNDLDQVLETFAAHGESIAAVIVEPVAGNMGVIPPADGFLAGLRSVTESHGALLIFDEVMTGFRVHPGGAQVLYGVTPDLTTLGKVIGGGLPVGAYGGRADVMEMVAPAGPVYQAGTLSGNPLAMAAGIATLRELAVPGVWESIDLMAGAAAAAMAAAADEAGVPTTHHRVGTMFCTFFTEGPVANWTDAAASDLDRFRRYFRTMLQHGVYVAPSQFEAGFMSSAHGPEEMEITSNAARAAMAAA